MRGSTAKIASVRTLPKETPDSVFEDFDVRLARGNGRPHRVLVCRIKQIVAGIWSLKSGRCMTCARPRCAAVDALLKHLAGEEWAAFSRDLDARLRLLGIPATPTRPEEGAER